jgi:hypothetical protein
MRFFLPLLPVLSLVPLAAADADWMPFGQGASVHKTGNTVSMDYKVTPGQLGLAILHAITTTSRSRRDRRGT